MKTRLLLAAAILAPTLFATPAMALDTSKLYKVCFEGNVVGTWRLRNRVVDTGATCRYTVQWQNLHIPQPLKRTTLCRLEELKASDDFDCERSRRGAFDTLVQKAQSSCTGFDEFGQQTSIRQLIAGENSDGTLAGIVQVASIGDVQSLLVVPND